MIITGKLPSKSYRIEESKDLNDIKVQELIGSFQTYELSLPSQRKSKSLALKTINERIEAHDSSDENVVDKDVAYLVKNFRKFLKFKKNGKFVEKGKFPSFRKEKRISKGKMEMSLNPLKESLVLNAMDMAISRRNVLII